MSFSINSVCLAGRLGADPELRYTPGGTAVLNMRMATTYSFKERDEWKQRTDWHNVVVWGKVAEILSKDLRKGSHVSISGSLQSSSYEDKSGVKRYKTEVIARDVSYDNGRSEARSTEPAPQQHDEQPAYDSGIDEMPF